MFEFLEDQQFSSYLALAIPDQDEDEEKGEDDTNISSGGG